jgi:hypothetical protein
MGRSETEILFVKSAEARMCKMWKTLPCLLNICFTSCYGTSHQGIVQSNTIQQASAPLSEVNPRKVRVLFPDFIHCQAKLTQPYNELTRQTGCKLYDFLSPYTLLLLSWKLCKNREHYRALNVKVRHESLLNREFSYIKKTRHFTGTFPYILSDSYKVKNPYF